MLQCVFVDNFYLLIKLLHEKH